MNAPACADLERASRRKLWSELLLVYASLEGALWTAGTAQGLLMILTVALATHWTLSGRRSLRELGLEPNYVRGGWWIVPIGAGIGAVILLGAWRWRTLRLPGGTPSVYVGVALSLVWALLQQFLAQSFFFLRLEQLLRSGRRAVIATALIFASAHIPNPVLVPVTLAGGLILSEMFRRYRTIYLLALAHALVALSLAVSVPESILHDMRVGIGYILYRP